MYRIAVTNRHLCQEDFLTRVEALAKGEQYDAILLREKDLPEAEYESLARQVLAITNRHGKKCILHFYPEVALALGHPYVHLPLSVWEMLSEAKSQKLRKCCAWIGTSVHSPEQLRLAERMGADYVTAGHIFSTACKADLPPRGLSFLKELCEQTKIPVYGIGGITRENEEAVLRQGAAGVCVMSGCMKSCVK